MLVASSPRSLTTANVTCQEAAWPRLSGGSAWTPPGSCTRPLVDQPLNLAHRARQGLGLEDQDLHRAADRVLDALGHLHGSRLATLRQAVRPGLHLNGEVVHPATGGEDEL